MTHNPPTPNQGGQSLHKAKRYEVLVGSLLSVVLLPSTQQSRCVSTLGHAPTDSLYDHQQRSVLSPLSSARRLRSRRESVGGRFFMAPQRNNYVVLVLRCDTLLVPQTTRQVMRLGGVTARGWSVETRRNFLVHGQVTPVHFVPLPTPASATFVGSAFAVTLTLTGRVSRRRCGFLFNSQVSVHDEPASESRGLIRTLVLFSTQPLRLMTVAQKMLVGLLCLSFSRVTRATTLRRIRGNGPSTVCPC